MEWKEYKLSEVTKQIFDGKHGGCTPEIGSGYYFASVKDISNLDFDYSNMMQIPKKEFDQIYHRTELENGDTLFANTGDTIGKSVFVKNNCLVNRTAFQKSIAILKPDTKIIDPAFLYYVLQYEKEGLRQVASGSGQKNLLLDTMRNYTITIPISVEEQVKISRLLENIDDMIKNNNMVSSTLESLACDIYNYWFVQFDFPDENGKPYKSSGGKMVWNEELKREIPEGWNFGTFGDVLDSLECGDRPSGGAESIGIPSIGAENINGIGRYDFSAEKYISEEYFHNMKRGIVRSWDVLMYKDGAGIGQASMFGDGFPHEKCAVNSHVFILRSEGNIYQDYLYLTLCQQYVKSIVILLAMKAAQPGLNQPAVRSVPLIIPPNSILMKFNNTIDPLFHMIFACSNESKKLSSLRDFLLPMLMNGQVKVEGVSK